MTDIDFQTIGTFTSAGKLSAFELNAYLSENVLFLEKHIPRACVALGSTQTITTSTTTTAELDTLVFDNDKMVNKGGVTTHRIDIRTAGYYWLYGQAYWGTLTSGYRLAAVVHNGAGYRAQSYMDPQGTIFPRQHVGPVLWPLNSLDYVELIVVHTQGSDENLNSASNQQGTYLACVWAEAL